MNLHPELDKVANRIVFIHGLPASGKTYFARMLHNTLKHKGFNPQIDGDLGQFVESNRNKESVLISENFPMQFVPKRDKEGNIIETPREWEILKSAHHMYINATDEDANFLMKERARTILSNFCQSFLHDKDEVGLIPVIHELINSDFKLEKLPFSISCYMSEMYGKNVDLEDDQLTQKGRREIIEEFHQNIIEPLLVKELSFRWGEHCGVPILSPLGGGRFGRAINHPTGGMEFGHFQEQVKFHVERISSSIFLYGEGRITGENFLRSSCKERR